MDDKVIRLVASKGDVNHDEQFEADLVAAIDAAYSNGVSRGVIITLLRVYEQLEVNDIIDSMND